MATQELEKTATVRPVGTIWEEGGVIYLRLEMPGVDKSDLDVRIEDDQLVIHGKRSDLPKDAHNVVRERRRGDFRQVYTVDDTVDREKIEANLESGVLLVTLHLKEAVKPRRIEIKAG